MSATTHRLFITSLSLAGLCACDFEGPHAADDPQFREDVIDPVDPKEPNEVGPIYLGPPVVDLTPASCFSKFYLLAEHTDGTKHSSKSVATALEIVRPGDLLTLDFMLTPACLATHGPRLTLIAYATPGITNGLKPPTIAPHAYDVHTGKFGEQGGQLKVRVPGCFFEVDLAFAEPVPADQLTTGYDAKRLVARTSGGKTSCVDVPRLVVDAFDVVGPGWGDAPVDAAFGWQLTAPLQKLQPTCEFDFEGDGKVDQTVYPCTTDTGAIKLAALPHTTYKEPGEHRPELVVRQGGRRVWASTRVYANHLDYRPDVRFPEQAPGFVGATLAAAEATVTLKYTSAQAVPAIAVGEVLVGAASPGYMLRASKVFTAGATLIVEGTPVGLDETIAGGFLGVRDLQIDTSGARCTDAACPGTLTVVDAPPGSAPAPVKPHAADFDMLDQEDQEAKFGVKIGLPLGEHGEIELFGGVVVKDFMIDWGFLSIEAANIQIVPTAELAISIKDGMETQSFEMGHFYVGTLPTPIPLSISLIPRFDADLGVKFTGKLTFTAPGLIEKKDGEWNTGCEPKVEAESTLFGLEQAIEAKITHVLETELSLGLLTGPYIGPMAAIGFKGTDDGCKGCLTSFVEGGAELGWNKPWGDGDLFAPFKVVLAEIELWKNCWTHGEQCEPPEPGPGGGCWGDVHLISLDGLLLDFQAGGEFVLVRATDGAPFEVQTRQEPMKLADFSDNDLSLSINTAVATVVDGHRVGLYTRHADPVRVDGQVTDLVPGAVHEFTAGSVALAHDGRTYTLTYPSGEVVTAVRIGNHGDPRAHFNVHVELPAARAGSVEGLLGDGDDDTSNDVARPGGDVMTQPVGFTDLYWSADNFADAWRIPDSLFDYTGGASPATFASEPYSLMPVTLPPAKPTHAQTAQQACGACPESLYGTCMTDVGFTDDPTLAAACTALPEEPVAEMPTRTYSHPIYPLPMTATDCSRNEVVFRVAPSIPGPFLIDLAVWKDIPNLPEFSWWVQLESFASANPPPGGWGDRFECRDLGAGWRECTWRPAAASNPCLVHDTNKYRLEVRSLPNPSTQLFMYEFTGGA